MKKSKYFYLVIATICSFLLLAACSGNQKTNTASTAAKVGKPQGGIATYGSHEDVMTFWDPSDSYSNEIIAMNNMYETLLRYNPKTQDFEKVLAEDYNVSKDGLTWTFKLRQGVKFQTGNELTADAAKASIERTMQRGKGAAFIWDSVKEIKAVDKYTLEFDLKYPAALDTVVSSGYAAYIFDAKYAEEKGGEKWFNEGHAAGTGPYMPEKWERGSQFILTAFDQYWGKWKTNNYQKVVFKTIPEANTRLQMAKGGQLQFVDQLPNELIKSVEGEKNVSVVKTNSFQQLVMQLNTQKAPLNNPKVRQAIAYAIPYDKIIKDVLGGMAEQSHGNVPKGLWGYDESLTQYHQDLDKAKQLLQEAGVNGGKLTLTYASADEEQRQIAELYKIELAKIGFNVEVKGMTWDAQWDLSKSSDAKNRQDIFFMYWWPDYADPYSFMKNLYGSEKEIVFNLAYYNNPKYDALITDAQQVAGVNRDKAIADYKQAQQILVDDVPGVSLYDRQYVRVIDNSFGGYVDNPAYPNVVFFHNTFKK